MEDRPFQILENINDNVYTVNLSSEYNVSVIFNVFDLPGELTKFRGIFNTFYLHLDYRRWVKVGYLLSWHLNKNYCFVILNSKLDLSFFEKYLT
jgi:hypothetical protein